MRNLEYIAGYFDGEGSVGIYYANGSNTLRATVGNTYLPFLRELEGRFGGSVSLKVRPGAPNRKPIYEWRAYGQDARTFLEAIAPYLTDKKPQVDLALTLPPPTPHGYKTSEETKQLREAVAQELRRLKHVEYAIED